MKEIKRVYAMVENEKVLLGTIDWIEMFGETTTPHFELKQTFQNCEVKMVRFSSLECDNYISVWVATTNDGFEYAFYTNFKFKEVKDENKCSNFIFQCENELVLQAMEYNDAIQIYNVEIKKFD